MIAAVRQKTAFWYHRVLDRLVDPSFLIIGSQKCGTTSLYRYLVQHPDVIRPLKKEIHFFDQHYDKGYTWYRRHFVAGTRLQSHRHRIAGEATPYYIFHPHAPARVRRDCQDVKLIVMLRDPVERAYSHYKHHVKLKKETLSFGDAVEAEPGRIAGEFERLLANDTYHSQPLQMFSYLSRGIYADQIKRWMDCFSKERMLILQSEAFFADPKGQYEAVLDFLGLPSYRLADYAQFNAGDRSRLPADLHARLSAYFRPHNQRLYKMIGTDFGWP
jgi:hypothetical protein